MRTSSLPTPTRTVALTRSFYEWEVHGRGWLRYRHPVQLAPPCVPFRPEQLGWVDDGRRDTLLSGLVRALTGTRRPPALPEAVSREPARSEPTGELIAFRLSAHETDASLNRRIPAFLKSLALTEQPLGV